MYFGDESRFGLQTILRRKITSKGIKPIAEYQHKFKNLYLFGAFSGVNGRSFVLELPYCNAITFQLFLDQFAAQDPEEFKILLLDNGAFHHAKALNIPKNIALLFLPPYSPELNPAEKIWRLLKDKISLTIHLTLEDLQQHLTSLIQTTIVFDIVKSICSNPFYQYTFQGTFNV